MRSVPVPLAQHQHGKIIKQLKNLCLAVFPTQRERAASALWHLCGSSHSSWFIMEQLITPLRQLLLLPHFQLKGLCLRQSSNPFLHVLTPIKHLSVCWAGVQIRVSLHSKEDVSHQLNQIQAARMLHLDGPQPRTNASDKGRLCKSKLRYDYR